ncbi:MAG: glycine oxidase ThiO [Pseudomonadota bacterium]
MPEFHVIGAGVAGLAVACELKDRGADVQITDGGGGPGEHSCSWWAGGMLAPHCERESAEAPVVSHGMHAADWWEAHGADVTRHGTIVLAQARDHGELRRFGRKTSRFEEIGGNEIGSLEPDLAGRFQRGLFFSTEAHIDPRQGLSALRARLAMQGVTIETGRAEPAPGTIDCRGLAAQESLPDLRGVKGEMLVLHCPDVALTRPVRLLHPRIPLYIVPRGEGIYMLGATMIETSERTRITARSMLELLSAAYALHPAFAEAEILEVGVDARPAFPDNLPRIRRKNGIIRANGLYRHGFLLAPALAQQVADLALGESTPEFCDEDHP